METGKKITRPYGLWPSPITPALLSIQLRFSDVQWDTDGETLVWSEGRSDRGVLVSRPPDGAVRDLTFEVSVRGGVGYGGGDFTVADGAVVFAGKDRLYRRSLGYEKPVPITPAFGGVASPAISPDGRWVLYVHSSAERQDSLGLVRSDGQSWPARLVSGADFYMQPAWHPQGSQIAWIEWDHPNMPWDGTRLMLAQLQGYPPVLGRVELVAGGSDTPIFQPAFSPDGRYLSYIAGEGEWDILYLLDLQSGDQRALVQGGSLARPAWGQGMRTYGWSPTSKSIFYLLGENGFGSLNQVDLDSGRSMKIDLGPYTWLSQIAVSPRGDKVAVIAEAPAIPDRIITWDGSSVEIVRRSDPEVIGPQDLPNPQPISWKAPDGTDVYGLYSPPTSSQYQGTGLPPAIIYIHGGPTSQVTAGYSSDAAFFTSRGYAWLDVNYRGSTGYGRSYMLALRERWGDVDTVDAVGGAQALVDQGLADPKRLVIKGGSAGGYTVLNALIHYPGKFKAGLCSYGVSSLFTLASDTHKLEERYTDTMVGPLPEAAERYHAWSPIFHADQIRDPIAVFQGSVDPVVVPDQSETIVGVLRQNKVPHIYKLYEGEGHGFRKSENVANYYEEADRFLKQHVIFSA